MSIAINSSDAHALVPNYVALAVWILTGQQLDKTLEKYGLKIAPKTRSAQARRNRGLIVD
jgi:hypothetical protein